jgi:hypothetical protein
MLEISKGTYTWITFKISSLEDLRSCEFFFLNLYKKFLFKEDWNNFNLPNQTAKYTNQTKGIPV